MRNGMRNAQCDEWCMSNEGIAFFRFLLASVMERWQVLMVDAKAAAPGANISVADFLHAELHPPSLLSLLSRLSILLVGWLEV